ncbi:cobyrinate a,c-diamide synthase [Salipaludibacillus sp. HK11]|uniref:cobyrinate a,c-diamide synthase n=1 Tax=Salipaludibacillus sp. HK11 TaxID=3394320 RepID=UPI0039FD63D0
MTTRRLVIAGIASGVGKTTITVGLMAAFKQRGLTIQGFKCGPDYIDPTYHTEVSRRQARNLDSWMFDEETLKEVLHKGSQGADISLIEGVMGFYDGKDPSSDKGSTADISVITDSPVLLVVPCGALARSAAAIVKGFQLLNEQANIVGVIANQVGSKGHYLLVKEAVEKECHIPVVGYMTKDANLSMPERHLGLIPSIERGELAPYFEQLGNVISETIDLDHLYKLAVTSPVIKNESELFQQKRDACVKIAVAKDKAFNFYYKENLELLEAAGAEIVYFSPLSGQSLPDNVDGLYLGGGFPEEYAEELSQFKEMQTSIAEAIDKGMPTFAECGGFMFLCESITTSNQDQYSMVGVLPGAVTMTDRLAAIGYREVTGLNENFLLPIGETVKGHEFHYSTHTSSEMITAAFQTTGRKGTKEEGQINNNLVAGYTHLHFASCPSIAERWVNRCLEWKTNG